MSFGGVNAARGITLASDDRAWDLEYSDIDIVSDE